VTDPPLTPFLALLARTTPVLVRRAAHRRMREPRAVERSLTLVVSEVRAEAEDVVSLRLAGEPAGEAPLPAWRPGAHLDLDLPSGRRRQYSLCGDPADRTSYRIAVRRLPDGEGGSREMHTLRPGARLRTQGPRNAFPLALPGPGPGAPVLFIAGGIGITPILPMVRAAAGAGADWRLLYTGRSRATLPFLDELDELDSPRVTVRTDDADGVPTAEDLLSGAAGPVYLCGPPAMIASVRAHLGSVRRILAGSATPGTAPRGVAETPSGNHPEGAPAPCDAPHQTPRPVRPRSAGQTLAATGATGLHFERFATPPVTDGAPFEVRLGPGGDILKVPADRSALSVIAEARPGTAYSCRQGFCGTCRVRVLDGEVAHHGSGTARRTDDAMLICVSRAAERGGRLTLDL
jgi:ferredoxin-NADP reductase/ferredoxin